MRQDGCRSVCSLKVCSLLTVLDVNCISPLTSGDVFESSTAESSPAPSANGASEKSMVTPTPTRPRTTEDLFAAIHRYDDALV